MTPVVPLDTCKATVYDRPENLELLKGKIYENPENGLAKHLARASFNMRRSREMPSRPPSSCHKCPRPSH
jgi:hypothetical protein